MGGDSCSKGSGFESQHHILDGHLFVVKIIFLFEKTKINEKEAGVSHFKKPFAPFIRLAKLNKIFFATMVVILKRPFRNNSNNFYPENAKNMTQKVSEREKKIVFMFSI